MDHEFISACLSGCVPVITDAAPSYGSLEKLGYAHLAVVEGWFRYMGFTFRTKR